jgi:hypothetical protein
VSRTTLGDRFRGKHASRATAYEPRRLLTDEQEKALLDWLDLSAIQGRPYDVPTLRSAVHELSGKTPGKNWCKRFCERHREVLTAAKASGLDPTRGKNFNEPTVRDYFQKITDIEEKFGKIPPTQIWNMDEKGIQLGGGRKHGCKKFFFLKKRRNRYKLRNDNLELVTILECVSAAGIAAPTSFVLVNGPHPDIRGVENVGQYTLG